MFSSLIREGELVISPTGRIWEVIGWTDARRRVILRDPKNDEQCELLPRFLRHASSFNAGQRLEEIYAQPEEVAG